MTPANTTQNERRWISGKTYDRRAEKAFDFELRLYKFDKRGKISSYTKFFEDSLRNIRKL